MLRLFPLLGILLAALAAPALAQDYGTAHRLKVEVGEETRKAVLFLPKAMGRNELLPLLVAIPDTQGKAYLEIGQWQQQAFEKRFAIYSVDITTSGQEGWAPSEQLAMQRDMEAVTKGLELADQVAREQGLQLDRTAYVLTGHSGGAYLTLWLGLRRPDLFLGVCGRSCVFHKETLDRGKLDTVPARHSMPIYLYRGELDNPRVAQETELAAKLLKESGYGNVTYEVIPRMLHESKPEVFLEWFYKLLKQTEKGRRESIRVAEELVEVRELIEKGKAGAYGKLRKLAEREEKAGFAAGAVDLLAEVRKQAAAKLREAEDLEANGMLVESVEAFRTVEKDFKGLDASREAGKRAGALRRTDGYKAAEMLADARELLEEDRRDKAVGILEKIMEKYPGTLAAEQAEQLLAR